jgi:hypothetical protein
MPVAPLKRSRPTSPDIKPPPQPLPAAVWEDHLLPLLWSKEAARLGCTCKALRGVVREHFKDLRGLSLRKLQAALTTFPRARTMSLVTGVRTKEDIERAMEWLRVGGHGGSITAMRASRSDIQSAVHAALQKGALPSLSGVDAHLEYETHRESLRGGFLSGMHELRLDMTVLDAMKPQLAALGLVRQLPALAKLEIYMNTHEFNDSMEWPPFIPPSLKELCIESDDALMCPALLRALPGMLEASGARLERLEVPIPWEFEDVGDGLVHLAQALRCCSPTLKRFGLSSDGGSISVKSTSPDYGDQVERLRVQWADVLAGVSACCELQVLKLLHIEVEPMEIEFLFPPGTAFARLTDIEISHYKRDHPPEAGAMGLWELMASGGLPALAKLRLRLEDRLEGREEVKTWVRPAFEAVAGTLTHLYIRCLLPGARRSDKILVGYELGVAVGKLRRLKDLALDLLDKGWAYHAVAQGLAAGGGDPPLPVLWRVQVVPDIKISADLLASLLLPSVRIFATSYGCYEGATLVMACAMRQAGYKHVWAAFCLDDVKEALRAIVGCDFADPFVDDRVWNAYGLM